MQRPVPVTGAVSQMFRDALASRGIEELPQRLVTSIDPTARMARLATGETLPYDLFVGIPVHRAPEPLAPSGLTVDGWVPVDQTNLRSRFPHVYALGDVCTGPRTVPKAGSSLRRPHWSWPTTSWAEISGETSPAPYEASGVCYAEFGGGSSARWTSTSSVASPRRPSLTTPRAGTPPRRPNSPPPAVPGGSDPDHRPRRCRGHRLDQWTIGAALRALWGWRAGDRSHTVAHGERKLIV